MASTSTLSELPVSIAQMSSDPKLDAILKRELNGDEQLLFATHFVPFMHTSNRKKDFVINLDEVYGWLGFAGKKNAKRAMVSGLEEGTHYIVKAGGSDVGRGGHNKEDVLMTVHGFKRLCMSIKTERGEMVRDYYLALEEALCAYNEEIIETERAEKEALRIEFDRHVEKTKRLMKRRFADGKKGNTTYIYKDSSDPDDLVYNVGETIDVAKREKTYATHNSGGDMLYAKRCMNRKVLEKLVHHMLDQYRIMRDREWFDAPVDIIKDALDTAQAFMDGYVNRCGNMLSMGIGAQIRDLVVSVPRDDERVDPLPDYVIADQKAAAAKAARLTGDPAPSFKYDPIDPVVENNPSDYDSFIADMCELREGAYTLAAELSGAHRLWGRCSDEGIRKGFFSYLRKKFPRVKKEYPDGSVRLAHVGIAFKPRVSVITEPTESSTDIQRFLFAECREDYVGRVGMKAIVERFETWKRQHGGDAEYKIHQIDKRRLEDYLSDHFLRGVPCTGDSVEQGYFGIVFIDDTARVGFRDNSNLRKQVAVLNPGTVPATLVKIFGSVQECASWFGVVASAISQDITYKRARKGFIVRKIDEVDKRMVDDHDAGSAPATCPGATAKVAGSGQWRKKNVEEVDAETGEVTQTFDTVKEAAEEASVESARMSTIIAKGRKHGGFYYRFKAQAAS
jgi:T5orf172 domain